MLVLRSTDTIKFPLVFFLAQPAFALGAGNPHLKFIIGSYPKAPNKKNMPLRSPRQKQGQILFDATVHCYMKGFG